MAFRTAVLPDGIIARRIAARDDQLHQQPIHRPAIRAPGRYREQSQLIYFHEVQKTIGNRAVISNLTLFLPKDSYTHLCGDRQSGKTTLVRLLMAYEKPDAGTLTVDGLDIGTIPDARIPHLRRQIGLIPETPALLEDRTVVENISVPLQLAGFDREVMDQRINAMLELTGLEDIKALKVNSLSAPARQVVSTARAIIHQPPVVVADEPLHNLDDETARLIVGLLNTASTTGSTVLVTCQNNTELLKHGATNTKTVTLKAGTISGDEQDEFEQDTTG